MPKISPEELIQCLENKEFNLYYQPIICQKNNTVYSMEGLSRWQSAGRIIAPMDFLPIINKYKQINDLFSLNVIEQASSFSRKNNCVVNINLNIKHLLNVDILHSLHKNLGLGSSLCIEILEEEKVVNDFQSIKIMNNLREKGALIALDDFGTGHNSLAYLSQFPIDIIKIDKQFLKDLNISKNQNIIQAVVQLAKALGIKVIAEGVETASQLEYVSNLGVDAVQGYYYSKPVCQEEAENYLESFLASKIKNKPKI